MREFRLASLQEYRRRQIPDWGPDISGLNVDNIASYVGQHASMSAKWEDVPDDIRDTF